MAGVFSRHHKGETTYGGKKKPKTCHSLNIYNKLSRIASCVSHSNSKKLSVISEVKHLNFHAVFICLRKKHVTVFALRLGGSPPFSPQSERKGGDEEDEQ